MGRGVQEVKVVYYQVVDMEAEIPICKLLMTPCDNPLGCLACYHQEVEDYRAFYAGEGEMPFKVVAERMKHHENRVIGGLLTRGNILFGQFSLLTLPHLHK